MDFRDLLTENVFGDIERGGAILTPLLGVLTSVPILVKIYQEMRP